MQVPGHHRHRRGKDPAILNDIDAWPIRGIVVISGKGFSPNMRYYLISSGKAVDVEDSRGLAPPLLRPDAGNLASNRASW